MFAPKPFDVAREMVRVTRPGGRIVMGNWIPGDPTFVAQVLAISASYSPPPPEGFISPVTWGIENNVTERFARAGVPKAAISFVRDTYTFDLPGTPSALLDAFRRYYGPTVNAFEAAEKSGRANDLQEELEILFNSQNKSREQACHLDSRNIPASHHRDLARKRNATLGSSTDLQTRHGGRQRSPFGRHVLGDWTATSAFLQLCSRSGRLTENKIGDDLRHASLRA
jgi:hypothetical protein